MMEGCHRTKANTTARNFGGGRFDELAFFDRSLSDDELLMFLGGYREHEIKVVTL